MPTINKKYRVAVLLPTYNSENFLIQQVASIFSQKGVSVELFVYDDFSTDSTSSILSEISKSYPISISPSLKKFGNASGSFFHLLQYYCDEFEKFDYIALADHDDVWLADKLIEAISLIISTNSSCYSSSTTALKYSGYTGAQGFSVGSKSSSLKEFDFLFEGPGAGCTFVLKKDFSIKLSEFLVSQQSRLNIVFWHDWFIYCYARINKYKWIIDERSFIIYIQHGKNETGVNSGLLAKIRRIKALLNGFYISQVRANLLLIAPFSSEYIRILRFNFFDRIWFALNIFSMRRKFFDALSILIFLILNPFSGINFRRYPVKF